MFRFRSFKFLIIILSLLWLLPGHTQDGAVIPDKQLLAQVDESLDRLSPLKESFETIGFGSMREIVEIIEEKREEGTLTKAEAEFFLEAEGKLKDFITEFWERKFEELGLVGEGAVNERYEEDAIEEDSVTLDYQIVILNNEDTVNSDNQYLLISAEPEMPAISVEVISESEEETEVKYRLKIEYRRDIRQDEDFFPSRDWHEASLNEEWEVDFGDKIRGGKATLYTQVGDARDTIEFHIRGTNPTEQAVKDYLEVEGHETWFFTRLIRQESNYRHFNNGTNYGPEWDDSQGCPNWGPPHGWGLTQLDLLEGGNRPTAQELWSWEANLDRGHAFLTGEKFNIADTHIERQMRSVTAWDNENPDDTVEGHADQIEGNITYVHASSDDFDYDWGDLVADDKSFLDAVWIKSYNGNSNSYYYRLVTNNDPAIKPEWELRRTNSHNHNYVEAVSNRAE